MQKFNTRKLLNDRRVLQEIERHQWFESEKLGIDIAFEQAAQDWLAQFSHTWTKHYWPSRNIVQKTPKLK